MKFIYDDGGRKSSGRRGEARDCVCRAIAIAAGIPYLEVYNDLEDACSQLKYRRGKVGIAVAMGRKWGARTGIPNDVVRKFLANLGWVWKATMGIGTGCKVHLREGEIPMVGTVIVSLSRHVCAVVDGVIRDTFDPSREGSRCVYGYWQKGA